MVVTDYNEQFLDKRGTDHLIDELKAYIDSISTGNVDLSDYVTKSELQAKLDALHINIDLSAYATKEELTNALSNIDLSAYATKEYVTDAINNAQLGGDVSSIDLSIYAKKSDLDSKANTEHTHTMSDITDYTEPDLSSYAKKTDIPDVSGYLTSIPEEYVTETELNAKGYLTEHQDLSAYALKTEIPSLDGYATTEYVDNAIANVPSGGNVDLSNYYTKAETNALIPSTEGFATTQYVDNAISNIPTTDLTNYYTKNETYSKTEVDTLVANSGGSSGGGSSSGITYAYDTEIATGDTYFDGRPIYMRILHIDPLSSAPSDAITYGNYKNQTPFADKIISTEPVWYTTSSTQNVFAGNVVQSFYPATGSSGSAAVSAVNRLLKTVAWVQSWQTKSEFAITVTRGQDMYHYACDIFVKYVKSA